MFVIAKVFYETIKLCQQNNHSSIEYQKIMKKAVLFPKQKTKKSFSFLDLWYLCTCRKNNLNWVKFYENKGVAQNDIPPEHGICPLSFRL